MWPGPGQPRSLGNGGKYFILLLLTSHPRPRWQFNTHLTLSYWWEIFYTFEKYFILLIPARAINTHLTLCCSFEGGAIAEKWHQRQQMTSNKVWGERDGRQRTKSLTAKSQIYSDYSVSFMIMNMNIFRSSNHQTNGYKPSVAWSNMTAAAACYLEYVLGSGVIMLWSSAGRIFSSIIEMEWVGPSVSPHHYH